MPSRLINTEYPGLIISTECPHNMVSTIYHHVPHDDRVAMIAHPTRINNAMITISLGVGSLSSIMIGVK